MLSDRQVLELLLLLLLLLPEGFSVLGFAVRPSPPWRRAPPALLLQRHKRRADTLLRHEVMKGRGRNEEE